MLKQLKLENWKSFEQATLFVEPLTVVTGLNASGKSNLIDALFFLKRYAETNLNDIAEDSSLSKGIRGGLDNMLFYNKNTFKLCLTIEDSHNKEFEFEMEFEVKTNGAQQDLGLKHFAIFTHNETEKITLCDQAWDPAEIAKLQKNKLPEMPNADTSSEDYTKEVANTDNSKIDNSAALIFIIILLAIGLFHYRNKDTKESPTSDELKNKITEGLLQHATNLLIDTLKKIFILNPLPESARGYAAIKDELQPNGANFVGVLAALPTAEQETVLNTMKKYAKMLPEREITDLRIEKFGLRGRDAMLVCTETLANGEQYEMDTRGLSDGTLRFLMILTAVLTLPKGSFLVIDEIDNGIHPSRAAMIVNMLIEQSTTRGIDIMVTAHNPAFLDQMMPDLIPFVMLVQRNTDKGSSVITPLQDLPNLNYLLSKGGLGRAISNENILLNLRPSNIV